MRPCMHATGQQTESWIWDSPAGFVGAVAPHFPAVETEVWNYAVSIQAPRLRSWQEPHPPNHSSLGSPAPDASPARAGALGRGGGWAAGCGGGWWRQREEAAPRTVSPQARPRPYLLGQLPARPPAPWERPAAQPSRECPGAAGESRK